MKSLTPKLENFSIYLTFIDVLKIRVFLDRLDACNVCMCIFLWCILDHNFIIYYRHMDDSIAQR